MLNRFSVFCPAMVAALFMTACTGKPAVEKQEKIIPVKVITVETGRAPSLQRTYVGTVEESVAVSLAFSSMGTVEQVFVSEGQRVRKGQLLATLNTATAENSYQMMLSKQQQAQDAYDRLVKVHDAGSLSEIQFVEVETGLQQAKSMTAVAKKNLDDCQMYAPRDGVIAARNIEVGSSAMPATAAFKLVSVDKVFVKIPVPENEIGDIQIGQEATIEVGALRAMIVVGALRATPLQDNAVFLGKIEQKGISANAMSHTYEVKIGVNNPQSKLMPGMVCKVETGHAPSLQDNDRSEIVVPNRTIQISADGRHFVWLADGNVAKRQFVKTGGLHDNGIGIVDGLSSGDKLIIEGLSKISEGMRINEQ
jgi:RND family efflux transporter MFP subunit